MKNVKVFTKKLKLDPKYLKNPSIKLMLSKPGTLSKREKEWLKSYVGILSLTDCKQQKVSRSRLSAAFIRSLKK